jgi:YidC/Oxa1 family membrane protein insertase
MEQKNMILAIVISMAILFGFQIFYETPRLQRQQAEQAARQQTTASPGAPDGARQGDATIPSPAAPATGSAQPGLPPLAVGVPVLREEVLARGSRIAIESPRLRGSIALDGGRIDDIVLTTYRETVDPESSHIVLLSPAGTRAPYYAEFGWAPVDRSTKLPTAETRWTANGDKLTPSTPVTLAWDNGEGLLFERRIALDDRYMVTVTQRVTATGTTATTLHPFAYIVRVGTPTTLGFFILHEGMVGIVNGLLKESSYDGLRDAKDGTIAHESARGGWVGITDKYWLVAVAPDAADEVKSQFRHTARDGVDRYQVDYLGTGRTLEPGQSIESTHRLFAGAKEVNILNRYRDELNIERFDYAVDWGWFYFLTKPIFVVMDFIFKYVGNFGIAILILTLVIKLFFFPLANKSYVMMSKMKLLTPQMMALREKYANDRQRMNQELMELYKKEKVNPLSGCLPILLQIPVFFALYKVLFVTIEMRHAPFYGWIKDLSAPDPTHVLNLFGLIPWTPPEFLHLGAWPLIMGVTMFLQQKLNPQPADPIQAKVFMLMPVIFTVLLASFPAGLVIYWAWNNTLSIAQQWLIMRRAGVKPGS